MKYEEKPLAYLVLDFRKEEETRKCLESIKKHTLFPHAVIYLHNGENPLYPYSLFREGLVDHFIQTKENTGLGIGTRDLFAACFSPYALYLQNDQFLKRDFKEEEFRAVTNIIGQAFRSPHDGSVWTAQSVDLAGGMWGLHGYSERAHILPTKFYKKLEDELPLSPYGAGPYDQAPWREEQIQKYYQKNKYLHFTYPEPLVIDNGHRAVRQNNDGSVWEHKTNTHELRLVSGPVLSRDNYPNFTDEEWDSVLRTQSWPEWHIPKKQRNS